MSKHKNAVIPFGFKIIRLPPAEKQATPLRFLRKRKEKCIEETGLTYREHSKEQRELRKMIEAAIVEMDKEE